MSQQIIAQPLTSAAFAPYGDVLDATGAPDKMINEGLCGRHHDRARLEFDGAAQACRSSTLNRAPCPMTSTLSNVTRTARNVSYR